MIFIVQNNQVALGTRVSEHHPHGRFDQIHRAYGVAGWSFDGNNVLDAYAATRLAANHCRDGAGPVVLSAETFRMGGHATHDEREARELIPPEVFLYWGARDPIGLYEQFLLVDGVVNEALHGVEEEITHEVEVAEREALASHEMNLPRGETALDGVYAPVD